MVIDAGQSIRFAQCVSPSGEVLEGVALCGFGTIGVWTSKSGPSR